MTETQPKQDKFLFFLFFLSHFSSFLTVYLLFNCRFVACLFVCLLGEGTETDLRTTSLKILTARSYVQFNGPVVNLRQNTATNRNPRMKDGEWVGDGGVRWGGGGGETEANLKITTLKIFIAHSYVQFNGPVVNLRQNTATNRNPRMKDGEWVSGGGVGGGEGWAGAGGGEQKQTSRQLI